MTTVKGSTTITWSGTVASTIHADVCARVLAQRVAATGDLEEFPSEADLDCHQQNNLVQDVDHLKVYILAALYLVDLHEQAEDDGCDNVLVASSMKLAVKRNAEGMQHNVSWSIVSIKLFIPKEIS